MANSDITKQAIAIGVKDLMTNKPFASISVSDIARRCHINRNTFYYHFQDKYDVITWIFYNEITPIVSGGMHADCWSDSLFALCRTMQENRTFYLNALSVAGQNSFTQCLLEFYQSLVTNLLHNADHSGSLTDEDVRFVSRFYAYALIGTILEWVKDGMTADPAPFIRRLERMINGELFDGIVLARATLPSESSQTPVPAGPKRTP